MGLKVKQDEENPVSPEVLAQAIVDIAAGMSRLNASRLNRRAILVLLNDMSGVPKRDIDAVLNGLDSLESYCLKPLNKK